MPPESVVLLLVGTWLLVAAAALWGMLRIGRRRYQHPAPRVSVRAAQARHQAARVRHAPVSH